jgi:hypothetical protein
VRTRTVLLVFVVSCSAGATAGDEGCVLHENNTMTCPILGPEAVHEQTRHHPKCGVDDNGNFKVCRTKAEIDACHQCTAADGWCICTEADRAAARKYFHSRGSRLWIDNSVEDSR